MFPAVSHKNRYVLARILVSDTFGLDGIRPKVVVGPISPPYTRLETTSPLSDLAAAAAIVVLMFLPHAWPPEFRLSPSRSRGRKLPASSSTAEIGRRRDPHFKTSKFFPGQLPLAMFCAFRSSALNCSPLCRLMNPDGKCVFWRWGRERERWYGEPCDGRRLGVFLLSCLSFLSFHQLMAWCLSFQLPVWLNSIMLVILWLWPTGLRELPLCCWISMWYLYITINYPSHIPISAFFGKVSIYDLIRIVSDTHTGIRVT